MPYAGCSLGLMLSVKASDGTELKSAAIPSPDSL